MFRNQSAWFSSSVPTTRRDFWILESGTITSWRSADYLFSADAKCPDTVRIFESKDYLWNKLVVFHCSFLTVCEMRQSVKSVPIGHYVLPPDSVQEEVRSVVERLIWEDDDEQLSTQESHESVCWRSEDEGENNCSNCELYETDSSDCEQPCYDDFLTKGYVSIDNLKKYSGDLCDFHPRCSRIHDFCCLPHTKENTHEKNVLKKNN
ncbi:uncharacterized protein V6R79_007392 [Siganus canaliculatus]